MATVSVAVLIRDEIEMLPLTMPCYASLQSALREVVFVDDGSTDGSKDKAMEIASHFKHLPIVWIEHTMTRWDEQRNIGLDACTGDFVLSLDADMGFTGNMVWLLQEGKFNQADVWDMHLLYCRGDQYHFDKTGSYRNGHFDWTTRLIKNCGLRYSGEAHEQPTVYNGVCKTALPSNKNGEGCPEKKYCEDVFLFEWSYLSSDGLLEERGKRLEVRWRDFMVARGIPPRSPQQYLAFKHSDAETMEVDQKVRDMIPTMQDALKHWGK